MSDAAVPYIPLYRMRAVWREAEIEPVTVEHAALDALLAELRRSHANGGAEFACFRVPNVAALHAFPRRGPGYPEEFFAEFLTSPSVRACAALSKFGIDDRLAHKLEIAYGTPFTLDGEIAQTMVYGGAYERFRGEGREAKALGAAFCDALFGDRYADVDTYISPTPWCRWFFDVAWDRTWFGLDRRLSRLWMLCVTDTD